MSGHSKWASIKHQKAVTDARRGQLFTKLTREIIVAVRKGGANQDANYSLRLAIQKARDNSMPLDNIERAIKRASGTSEGTVLNELVFEGYGPGGVAILVQALTDNKNRTLQEVRNVFTRGGGNLGENGCVAWLFDSKGVITVEAENTDSEELALAAIDAGAEDVDSDGPSMTIYTAPDRLEGVRKALEANKLKIGSAEVSMVPKTTVELGEKEATQTLRLLEKLEELDDVRNVSSNANFTDAVLQEYQG